MSTGAQAVAVQQQPREIQTLGGAVGDGGVIAGIFASRMRNPQAQFITNEAAKSDDGDGIDQLLDNGPDDNQSDNEQVSQAVAEGPGEIGSQATAVPEPGILGLFGIGLLGLGLMRRRRG